jgi:ketopantoate hydroxymethyltransferase
MMIEHSKSVRMGIKKILMVVDMPYGTYKTPKPQNPKTPHNSNFVILILFL